VSAAASLKIIFAGTPSFAEVALEALIHSTHQVIAVYTQPDRPAGRGLKSTESPVKCLAQSYALPLFQPQTLKDSVAQEGLAALKPDLMVVAAYGMMLPPAVLALPRLGCLNIHPSLLPRWRGAAPIQRAIFAGDKKTGVTIMQMDAGLDTGPILLQREYEMHADETSQTLHDALAVLGARTLIETIDLLAQHKVTPQAQNNDQATYAQKITKEEALIDWEQPAEQLEEMIRAFNPWPVAYTTWQGANLRIWQAKALSQTHQASPRTILQASREGIDIATGKEVLRLLQLQLPGGKVLSVADFYNARQHELIVGQHLI